MLSHFRIKVIFFETFFAIILGDCFHESFIHSGEGERSERWGGAGKQSEPSAEGLAQPPYTRPPAVKNRINKVCVKFVLGLCEVCVEVKRSNIGLIKFVLSLCLAKEVKIG